MKKAIHTQAEVLEQWAMRSVLIYSFRRIGGLFFIYLIGKQDVKN